MFQRLVRDTFVKGRWIAYSASTIRVYFENELRSLAELFACLVPASIQPDLERHGMVEALALEQWNMPPPCLEDFLNTSSPVRVARSVTLASVCLAVLLPAAQALPEGYQSVSGNVQFSQTGDTLNVTTGASKAIASYQRFNVAQNETVNFNLPNSRSAILNRVTGGDPSQIMGRVNSNGQVYMVNPAGIVFGQGAQVNVGGLHASTLNISDSDFLDGNNRFKQEGPGGAISNAGSISAGAVTLIGSVIDNSGTITATAGQVNLAVGERVTMVVDDSLAVNVTVDTGLQQKVAGYSAAIHNTGTVSAQGGGITAQAKLQSGLYEKAINNEGLIEALNWGDVILTAHTTSQDALIRNAGQLDVSGDTLNANGGRITLNADYIIQRGVIKAEGAEGGTGGHIDLSSTQGTLLTTGSLTSVKGAADTSHGGDILIWSDGNTYFRQGGVIDVSGGSVSGNAGFVEVSGKETVYFQGQAIGRAVNGQAGRILIDPIDIVISNAGGDSVDGGDAVAGVDESFGEGNPTETYDPQSGGAFNGFGDIWLQATNDITINSAFDTDTATSNSGVSITLEANNDIFINAALTTHNAAITLIADADSSGVGNITANASGTLTSNNGAIDLSGVNIALNSISAGSGNITITATGTINDIDDTGDNITNTGTLTLTSNGAIGNSGGAQGLNINTGDVTITSTGGNNITLRDSGALTIDLIATGGAGAISLTGVSGIQDTDVVDDSVANITTTGTVALATSNGDIGSETNTLDIDTGTGANGLSAHVPYDTNDIFIEETSGSVILGDYYNSDSTISGVVYLSADSITLAAGKKLWNYYGQFVTDSIDLQGNVWLYNFDLTPKTPSTTIGLGGGAGALNLDSTEFSKILSTASTSITIGQTLHGYSQATGDISLGSVDLSSKSANLYLYTSGNVVDATPADDSTANIKVQWGRTVSIYGLATQIGSSGLGDIDIDSTGGVWNNVTAEGDVFLHLWNAAASANELRLESYNGDANVTIDGSVTLQPSTIWNGDLTLSATDIIIQNTTKANNITLTATTGETVLGWGAYLVAQGTGQHLYFTPTTLTPLLGTTITAASGAPGILTINGETNSTFYLYALDGSGTIYINTTYAGIDVTNTTFVTTAGAGNGTINLVGDTNAANNGNMYTTTADYADWYDFHADIINGTNVSLTATHAYMGFENLSGNFHGTKISGYFGGNNQTLTDTTSNIVIGNYLNDMTGLTVNAQAGSITFTGISASGALTLNAFTDMYSTGSAYLGGTTISLNTTTGNIGAVGNRLRLSGSYLAPINISSAGDAYLNVPTDAITFSTVSVADVFDLTAAANIEVAGTLHSDNTVKIVTSGGLKVSNTGSIDADGAAGASGAETIILEAGDYLYLHGGAAANSGSVLTTAGNISLASTGSSIFLKGGTNNQTGSVISASNVVLDAYNEILLIGGAGNTSGSVSAAGAVDITNGATRGYYFDGSGLDGMLVDTTGATLLPAASYNVTPVNFGFGFSFFGGGSITAGTADSNGHLWMGAVGSSSDWVDSPSAQAAGSVDIYFGELLTATTGQWMYQTQGNAFTLTYDTVEANWYSVDITSQITLLGAGNSYNLPTDSIIVSFGNNSANQNITMGLNQGNGTDYAAHSAIIEPGKTFIATPDGGGNYTVHEMLNLGITNTAPAGFTSIAGGGANSGSIIASGASNVTINSGGSITSNLITSGSGNVALTASGGTINDTDDVGSNIITSGTLILSSSGTIGDTSTLNIDTGNITVSSTGGNNLSITDSGAMTISSITTGGAGDIELNAATSLDDIDDTGNNITTTGTLSLTSNGAIGGSSTLNISTGDVSITSSGGNNITLTDSGAFTLASIATGGAGTVTLTGTSLADTDGADDDTANITTTGNIILTATSGSIGSLANEVDVDAGVGSASLSATSSANIFLQEVTGVMSLDSTASGATGAIYLKAPSLDLPAGKTLSTKSLRLRADAMQIDGTISYTGGGSHFIYVDPLSSNTTIGLGGGSGTLNLTDAELNLLSGSADVPWLYIGRTIATTGTIEIGTINLTYSGLGVLEINSQGALVDASPDDSVDNVTLFSNLLLYVNSIGSAGLGDIDVLSYSQLRTSTVNDQYIGTVGDDNFTLQSSLSSAGSITVNSGASNMTTLSSVTASQDITVTTTSGTQLRVFSTTATNGDITLNANALITGNTLTSAGNLNMTANGTITLPTLSVGDITVTSSGGNNITLSELAAMTIVNIATGGAGYISLTSTSTIDDTDDIGDNIVTTGTLSLTSNGAIGGSSTLNISSGDVTVTTTGGNNITLSDSGALTIASIATGGAGNISLTSASTLDDTDDVGNNITTTGTLSLTSNGAIGGSSTLNISSGDVTVTSTGGNNITLSDSGALTLASIATGGAGNISLTSASTIDDTDDVGDNITTTGMLSLTSNGAIGGSSSLNISTGDVTITSTGGNNITLTDSSALTIASIDTGGAGNISLNASTTINDVSDGASQVTTTGTLTLTSNGAIGGANANGLEINAGNLTVSSTGGNAITLYETGAMTIASIATGGAGAISLTSTSSINDIDDTAPNINTTGTLSLTSNGAIGNSGGAQGLNITAGDVTITSTGGNNITLRDTGALTIANIATGGAGNITLTGSTILDTDAVDDNIANITTTGNLILTSNHATSTVVGNTANELDIQIGGTLQVTASTTSTANVYIQQSSGELILDNITASGAPTGGWLNVKADSVTLPVGKTITNFNGNAFQTDAIDLSGNINSWATLGILYVIPLTPSTTIGLGGGVGTLNITSTEFSHFSGASMVVGNSTVGSGNIDIDTLDFSARTFGYLTLYTTGVITDGSVGEGTPNITFPISGTLYINGGNGLGAGQVGGSGAADLDVILSSTSTPTVNIKTNNADVYLDSSISLESLQIDSGSGNIILTSLGEINDTAGSITNTGTLTMQSNGAISLTTLSTGDITIISSGGNNVTLNETGAMSIASIATGGTGNISLTSTSTIDDTDDVGDNITTTGTLSLTSTGAIGSTTSLNLSTGDVTITSTGGNNITLTESGALTISSIATGGAGNISLNASTTIDDVSDGASHVTTTGTLSFTSNGAIGGANANGLEINAGNLTVSSTGGNAITLYEYGAMTINSMATGGAGAISLTSTSTINDIDDTAPNINTTGTLILTSNGAIGNSGGAQGLNVTAGDITITTTGGNNITLRDTGAFTLASIATGGAGTVTLTGTSLADTDGADDDTANITTTGNIILTATSGSIGSLANEVDVDAGVGSASLSATSSANIFLQEVTGVMSLDSTASGATGAIYLKAPSLDLPAGKTLSTKSLTLRADAMQIDGTVTYTGGGAHFIYVDPLSSNTTIGLGGGSGALNLTSTELNKLAPLGGGSKWLYMGRTIETTGTIEVETLNLTSTDLIAFEINSQGALVDVSPDDSVDNVTLWSELRLYVDSIGSAGLGDLDVFSYSNITTYTVNDQYLGTVGDDNFSLLNAQSTAGSITVNSGASNWTTLGSVTASQDITVTTTSGTLMSVSSSTATNGDITLNANALITGGNLTSAGNLNMTANGSISLTVLSVGDISVSSSGGNNVTLSETGAMTLSSIATGGAGAVSLTSTSTIDDIDDVGDNISTTGTLSLTSNGAIGGSSTLNISTGDVTVTSSGGNNITLSDSGALTMASIATGGAGNISLTSASTLDDTDDVGNNITTTGTLSLTSNGAIGGSSTLNISSGDVTVTSSGGNNITLTDSGALTLASIATGGAGNISLTSASTIDDNDNVGDNISTTGTLSLTSNGAIGGSSTLNIDAGTLTVTDTGGNNITITDSGALTLASIETGGAGDITLTAGTSLNDVADAADYIITSGNLSLTAGTHIGNSSATGLNVDIGGTVSLSAGGNITLTEGADLNIGTISATGDIALVSQTGVAGSSMLFAVEPGDITLTGSVSGASVLLEADGNILDGNVGATDIFATAGGTLNAGGWIGTWANPLEIQISGGTMGIRPLGITGAISTVINGSVAPVDTLTLLNSPLGEVWYNGILLWPTSSYVPPSDEGVGVDWNGIRYSWDEYRSNTSKDYVEARLLFSKVLSSTNPALLHWYIVPRILSNGSVLYHQEWARSFADLEVPSDEAILDVLTGELLPLRSSMIDEESKAGEQPSLLVHDP